MNASFDRPGFEQDFKLIATVETDDAVHAGLHPSNPKTNQDLIARAANDRFCTASRHLIFSIATVPMTDGNSMRLNHFGYTMNRNFCALTIFHAHHYADNYSPDTLQRRSN